MKKVLFIRSVEDLENVRLFNDYDRLTIIILNDVFFENGYNFVPINLENTDVIIYGFNNCINSISVKNEKRNYSGLFSKVKSLNVKYLRMYRADINGDEICGVLAGRVSGDVNVSGLFIDGVINCDALGGGIVGVCNNINVENSFINTIFNARGALGGLAAMAEDYKFNNSDLNISFNAKDFRLIDHYVAYLGKREGSYTRVLAKELSDEYDKKEETKLMLGL